MFKPPNQILKELIKGPSLLNRVKSIPSPYKPKVGLALGGGSVWGVAHIGVLKAMEDHQVPIHYISGTSAGALVGGMYAAGIPVERLKELAFSMQWKDISKLSLPLRGLLSNEPMDLFITNLIGNKTFDDLQIPFSAVATDLVSGKEVILDSGNLSTAIRASTAIPGIFQPVSLSNQQLADGMIVNKVPASLVKSMGANVVIAVNLFSSIDHWAPRNSLQVILKSYLIMQQRIASHETSHADITLHVDLKNYNPMDFTKAQEIYNKGYAAALNQMDIIQAALQRKK